MDLRRYHFNESQLETLKRCIGYQPYIITDDYQTGIGNLWANRHEAIRMHRGDVDVQTWTNFVSANQMLRQMYDDWIGAVCSELGDLSGRSVIDTACNSCFFPFRFMERGAASAIGYDRSSTNSEVVAVMREVTGWNVNFINEPYDQMRHEIAGCQPADIVVSTAIMCHISDPTYYLSFLSKITKDTLLLFSKFSDHRAMQVSYADVNVYTEDPFPICFDKMTVPSLALLKFGLKACGFKTFYEIPHRDTWLPTSWYTGWHAFVCRK